MIRNIPNVTSTYSTITFGLNFMGTFSMCPIFCHWEHCDHISGGHFKCIWLVTLGLHNQGHSRCDQPFTTGHIEVTHWVDIQNVANFWSLGTLWSSVVCNHNVFNMCPLGIYPLVPSEKQKGRGVIRHTSSGDVESILDNYVILGEVVENKRMKWSYVLQRTRWWATNR